MGDEISSPGNESLWLYCQKLFYEIHQTGLQQLGEGMKRTFPSGFCVSLKFPQAMKNVC